MVDLWSPKLFFESSHVLPLFSNLERLILDRGIVGPLGELLGLSGLGSVLIGLACRHRTVPLRLASPRSNQTRAARLRNVQRHLLRLVHGQATSSAFASFLVSVYVHDDPSGVIAYGIAPRYSFSAPGFWRMDHFGCLHTRGYDPAITQAMRERSNSTLE